MYVLNSYYLVQHGNVFVWRLLNLENAETSTDLCLLLLQGRHAVLEPADLLQCLHTGQRRTKWSAGLEILHEPMNLHRDNSR